MQNLVLSCFLAGCASVVAPEKRAEVHFRQGVLHNYENQYDLAVADFDQALSLNPRYVDAYINRGDAYIKRGVAYGHKSDRERAITDYIKALELNPQSIEAYVERAVAYLETEDTPGDFARAITDYNRLLELIDPKEATFVYFNRGLAHFAKGDFSQAITDYNLDLALDPNAWGAYYQKALACENAGRFAEAIEAYRAFIDRVQQPKPVPGSPYCATVPGELISFATSRLRELDNWEARHKSNPIRPPAAGPFMFYIKKDTIYAGGVPLILKISSCPDN